MNLLKVSRLLLLTAAAAAVLAPPTYAQVKAKAIAKARPVMPRPAAAGHMRSHAMILYSAPDSGYGPGQTDCSSGCYYAPKDLITAYAVGSIAHGNGGAGMVVGIVDAYYNSQTADDLNASIAEFGLAACPLSPSSAPLTDCLTIVGQTGCSIGADGCTTPGSNDGWATETDLDVQIVHAIAPNAKILLVACDSDSDIDLFTGDQYAEATSNVVTNSFGGNEFSGETTAGDFYFSGSTVPLLFSSGDTGAETEYPCTSIYALCVGGTSLLETATSFRNIEGAWGNVPWVGNEEPHGGGGGCSTYEAAPSFQSGYSTCGSARGVPDVSAIADPATGFIVYLGSFAAEDVSGSAGFYSIGGTSLASPLTAAVIANIDADRVYNSKSVLGSNLNALIYAAAASYRYRFYDVSVGSTSDGTTTLDATTGWDQATGLGVILGPSLATYLLTTP